MLKFNNWVGDTRVWKEYSHWRDKYPHAWGQGPGGVITNETREDRKCPGFIVDWQCPLMIFFMKLVKLWRDNPQLLNPEITRETHVVLYNLFN